MKHQTRFITWPTTRQATGSVTRSRLPHSTLRRSWSSVMYLCCGPVSISIIINMRLWTTTEIVVALLTNFIIFYFHPDQSNSTSGYQDRVVSIVSKYTTSWTTTTRAEVPVQLIGFLLHLLAVQLCLVAVCGDSGRVLSKWMGFTSLSPRHGLVHGMIIEWWKSLWWSINHQHHVDSE